jgi:hypothetical protein
LKVFEIRSDSGYKYLQPSQAFLHRLQAGMATKGVAPFWGHSMVEIWPKGTWNVFADRGVRDFGDFVGVIPSSVFGVSDSALPAFGERYGRFGEFLEINIRKRGSPHVHLFNTLNKIDALDHERSRIAGNPNRRIYGWIDGVLSADMLFRDSVRSVEVYCTSDGERGFPEFCAEHGFVGLSFHEVGVCEAADASTAAS